MFRTRSAAVLVSIALGTVGMLTTGGGSAAVQDEPTVVNLPAVEPEPGNGFIVGVVRDGERDIDDVLVQAVGPDSGADLTYASPRDGGPQHGFYRIEVPAGRYRLTFERSGYVTEKLTAKVRVVDGETTEAPTVTLARPSKCTAKPKDNKVTTAERAKVVVVVTSKATPTGAVTVKVGRKVVGTGKLRKADDGTVTVTLPKLGKGTYQLVAGYAGSETAAAAKASAVKLTVTKPRK